MTERDRMLDMITTMSNANFEKQELIDKLEQENAELRKLNELGNKKLEELTGNCDLICRKCVTLHDTEKRHETEIAKLCKQQNKIAIEYLGELYNIVQKENVESNWGGHVSTFIISNQIDQLIAKLKDGAK